MPTSKADDRGNGAGSPHASLAKIGSVGLVHDYLLTMRGAERTFAAIADCFPDAPIYTMLYDPAEMAQPFSSRRVQSSYLQRLGIRQRGFRRLLPLYPRAVESLPLQHHELVVSSSSAFAHGIRPAPGAIHICYCHNPFRYVWHERELALAEFPARLRPLMRRALDRSRRWDQAAASRVTQYIANSELVRERIQRFYGREASVVHPPVDIERFAPGQAEDFFLVVSQLVRHKRVEVALEAAERVGRPLKVVGDGPDLDRLRSLSNGRTEFLGRATDATLADLYSRARAIVVPGIEEFGIAAVEAQAAGRPVLATDAGGARETVVPGETGVLVPGGRADSFAEAMREVDFDAFSSARIRRHAERFSRANFRRRFTAEVARLVEAEVANP